MSPTPPSALAALADGATDDALESAARAVTDRLEELIGELAATIAGEPFWRAAMWRAVEILHATRAAGAITDVDEIYRIWAVAEATARRVRDDPTPPAPADAAAAHERALSEARALPPRAQVPGVPAPPGILDRGAFRPIDRVDEATARWQSLIDAGTDPAQIDARFGLDRGEHGRALHLVRWAADEGLLSDGERDALLGALGTYRGRGGWPPDTAPAVKAAVNEIIAGLHDLFGAQA